ncbi:MAG: PEP/pyruvate-binding domain-containing protein [Proteobacteria bacterium]|nr:PEP/pyruvate-binding domain-containing protein [Pseudomonadota bacterium]
MNGPWNIFKIHLLTRKKGQFPHISGLINNAFIEALEQRGIITRERLHDLAIEGLKADDTEEGTEENLQEYVDALTDAYVANFLTPWEIENYINLARKREKAQILSMVANRDQATSMEIYRALRETCEIPQGEVYMSPEEAIGIRVALLSRFFSSQLPFVTLAKNHIVYRDIDKILQRTLWSRKRPGRLGGKAAGMNLARAILLPSLKERDPELERYIRTPDTWYLNSGVFSEFLDRNNLYLFHTFKYKDREAIEEESQRVEERFKSAEFADEVVEDFRKILTEIGEHPIIIRSSSMLEDSFGLAFAGKYLSVFLTNQGDLETRLDQFIHGMKRVFASTFAPDPILYRLDHGLLDFDERMAMVVQKVVGRQFGKYFFPFVSGVLFSRNIYAWSPKIRKEEGLARIVLGLATRAVDRVGSDYPRMIPLSHPLLRPEISASQIEKYSQRQVDVLNLETGFLETVDFLTLRREIDHPDLYYAVSINQDGNLAAPHFKGQDLSKGIPCLTFENLLKNTPFVHLAKKILSKVEAAYGRPVDMEFAWDDEKLYILQCRSLSMRAEPDHVIVPTDVPRDKILFTTNAGLVNGIVEDLDYVVYVDPKAYDRLRTFEEKMEIARAVNLLNKRLSDNRYALMGPGRWGSNDINLGVKVTYSDIRKTKLLAEVAFAKEGYTPEVSYGTHFFQDLVEANIVMVPLFPESPGAIFNEDFFLASESVFLDFAPEMKNCESVVRVIHIPSIHPGQFLHVYLDSNDQKGIGFFGPKRGSDEAKCPKNSRLPAEGRYESKSN